MLNIENGPIVDSTQYRNYKKGEIRKKQIERLTNNVEFIRK